VISAPAHSKGPPHGERGGPSSYPVSQAAGYFAGGFDGAGVFGGG
jgi:hypothetical protein